MLSQFRPAIMMVVIITVMTGLVFPFAITGIGKAIFPAQAEGSLVRVNGKIVGSSLIGQGFAAPGYFHPRPSAAGNGYDAGNSGATNLGPTSDKLINGIHKKLANGKDDPGNFDGIKDLAKAYRDENKLSPATPIPADVVTRSASGLDPQISPANAELQVNRVAAARGLSLEQVQNLVAENTDGRQLGLLGEPRVNVLLLNLALDKVAPGKAGKAAVSYSGG